MLERRISRTTIHIGERSRRVRAHAFQPLLLEACQIGRLAANRDVEEPVKQDANKNRENDSCNHHLERERRQHENRAHEEDADSQTEEYHHEQAHAHRIKRYGEPDDQIHTGNAGQNHA